MDERPFKSSCRRLVETDDYSLYDDTIRFDHLFDSLMRTRKEILDTYPGAKNFRLLLDVDYEESGSWHDISMFYSRPMTDLEYQRYLRDEERKETRRISAEKQQERRDREEYERLKAKFEGEK